MLQKLIGGLLCSGILFAQTTANPQFSVIGDLVIDQLTESPQLSSSGVEIAIQGNVNPFARADVYLHKHNDESPLELEEAVLTIERGLPFGLALRAGKLRPELGKMNKTHAHLFPFIEAPSGMTKTLGQEFYSATGIEANWLLPLPWYSNLSIGFLDTGIGSHAHEEEDDHEEEDGHDHNNGEEHLEEEKQENAFSSRWSHFFDLNEVNHIEIGTSYYADHEKSFGGADFKFKWRPNKYRSFTIQGEWIQFELGDEHEGKKVHSNEILTSGYLMINYQFSKAWNVGVIGDYWQFDLADTHGKDPSIFVGFSPVEESVVLRIKLGQVLHPEDDHNNEEKQLKVSVQLIWSLGPHKPHRY
ncbi:MAG: hypothetical protein ISR82_06620 [Candidatus Marinimicrobia bacterium]|nr:hypothetical protein [Candidatus Neomarinimicrobiota bacterium]MBL7010878.1 hypothetical protein [Candidatus Neomarinimicrobiota bacterium]MBL7030252.1 hypothetical protein [Candidatus Neomarinimicrobiota bacterium]